MLVKRFEGKHWKKVSAEMLLDAQGNQKTAMQCYSRWTHTIKPRVEGYYGINKENELILLKLYSIKKYTKKWSDIGKIIGGRNFQNVRNHYLSIMKKELWNLRRLTKYKFESPEFLKTDDLTIEYIDNILRKFDLKTECLKNENIKTMIESKRELFSQKVKDNNLIEGPIIIKKGNLEGGIKKKVLNLESKILNLEPNKFQKDDDPLSVYNPSNNFSKKIERQKVETSSVLFSNRETSKLKTVSKNSKISVQNEECPIKQELIPNPLRYLHFIPPQLIEDSYLKSFNNLKNHFSSFDLASIPKADCFSHQY